MVRRLASTIPVLLIVSMLTFSLTNVLGGDPLLALMGEEEGRLSPEAEAIMREHVQFAGEYLCECVKRGDLPAGIGHSPAGSDTIVSAAETSALTRVRAEKQKPREQA